MGNKSLCFLGCLSFLYLENVGEDALISFVQMLTYQNGVG